MSGFVGCAGAPASQMRALFARMLATPSIRGIEHARVDASGLCAFGARDVDLFRDAGAGALVLTGYARLGARHLAASEVLAEYRRSGTTLFDRLSGEFALAVCTEREVLVARDRLGTRPLYVAELPDGVVVFGTSLGALLAAGADPSLDRDAVVRSLVLAYTTGGRTIARGVRQLAPGEAWTLTPARVEHRYWCPRERIDPLLPERAAARAVDRAVTRAVRRALPKTGRVGAFLSGGMDSSIVLARLVEIGAPVTAFTLHFGDDLPSEIRYATEVARHLRVPHRVVELDDERFVDGLEPAMLHLEDALSEAIAVPNFLLAREAAREVDVVFTGEGGDQGFGGPKNVGMAIARAYASHPASPTLAQSYLLIHQHMANDLGAALTRETLAQFDPLRLSQEIAEPFFGENAPGDTFVGRVMIGNTVVKGGSNILVKVAKVIASAHDLALRSPMFDPDVIRLAFTIPPRFKLLGASEEKLVLRRAARRSLPATVLDRPKRGMSLPMATWFKGRLGEVARDVLTERSVRDRGLFRWPYVDELLRGDGRPTDAARSRDADKLWLVLATELHCGVVERLARPEPARESLPEAAWQMT